MPTRKPTLGHNDLNLVLPEPRQRHRAAKPRAGSFADMMRRGAANIRERQARLDVLREVVRDCLFDAPRLAVEAVGTEASPSVGAADGLRVLPVGDIQAELDARRTHGRTTAALSAEARVQLVADLREAGFVVMERRGEAFVLGDPRPEDEARVSGAR